MQKRLDAVQAAEQRSVQPVKQEQQPVKQEQAEKAMFPQSAKPIASLPSASWDYAKHAAYIFRDGVKMFSQRVYPLDKTKGDASPVGAMFDCCPGREHRIVNVWYGFVANSSTHTSASAVVRKKDRNMILHSSPKCVPFEEWDDWSDESLEMENERQMRAEQRERQKEERRQQRQLYAYTPQVSVDAGLSCYMCTAYAKRVPCICFVLPLALADLSSRSQDAYICAYRVWKKRLPSPPAMPLDVATQSGDDANSVITISDIRSSITPTEIESSSDPEDSGFMHAFRFATSLPGHSRARCRRPTRTFTHLYILL
jgi:hypothetical protein